ncbi:helix-turn-helix domain-containing protein [Oceanobacillus sp. FSL H7-0719]|uniref:helix-turn-helix domain-containing protein n=1 Tax=Oceanobacillus sp. FSL H7-0719 TaxID=2954507 RepID=UPI003253D252
MDVGARLKEARLAKGLSLDSLQDTTKIQKRYLVAIEEGNFNILPGKFYARAFIKEYANAVGIDPNELLEEHKEEIPKSEEESEIQYTRVERSRKENSNDRSGAVFSVLPKIIVILLIIGIIGAAIWFISQSNSSDEPTEIEDSEGPVVIKNPDDNNSASGSNDESNESDSDAEENTSDETDSEDEEAEEAEEVTFETVEAGQTESTMTLTNPGDELIFSFESETRSWLDVKNAAGESLYGGFVGPENSPLEVDAAGTDSVFLNIGSAPNLQIKVNDTEFEYPIDPSERDVQKIWININ